MVSMLQGVWRCTHLPGPRFCTESGQQELRFAGPEMETEPTGGTHRQKRAEEHRDIWGLSGNHAWDGSRDLTPSAPSESHTDALSAGHRGPASGDPDFTPTCAVTHTRPASPGCPSVGPRPEMFIE